MRPWFLVVFGIFLLWILSLTPANSRKISLPLDVDPVAGLNTMGGGGSASHMVLEPLFRGYR